MSRIFEGQAEARSARRGLVGRDLSHFDEGRRRRIPSGLILGVLLAAFLLTFLRVNILHLGYAQGEALAQEQRLQEERRVLAARAEALRSPERLSRLAAGSGFQRAEHVLDLTRGALLDAKEVTHP